VYLLLLLLLLLLLYMLLLLLAAAVQGTHLVEHVDECCLLCRQRILRRKALHTTPY
jgi:hypothetical protein